MLNAHDAHLPSFSLYDNALMTMPSEKGRIVAGNQEAIRRLFKVTRVSTGNMPTLPATFPDGIAPVGGTGAQWPDSRRRYPEGIAASLLVTMGDGWLWRKPNPATLLAAGAAAQLQLLYPPRLRRGLAAISSPRASVLLRRGKTTPIYRLIRESCRENGAGNPCCGDCCRCPVFPSRASLSGGERQTRTDDRDRRDNWSGNRQIREGSADVGGRTAGRHRYPASEHSRRPRHQHARDYRR